jgi:hypothetical protein
VKSIRVHAPAPVVFVCGGPYDVGAAQPQSLRDAFMRITHKKPFEKHESLLAEDLNAFFPVGKYKDILSFEADLAQIADLIILFSESYGSAAELGAFSMVEEIAHRLLVVIDDKNYNTNSFITLGPLKSLENIYGESAICVLNREDIKIAGITNISGLDAKTFEARIAAAFETRMRANPERTSFNMTRPGHLIKFAVGLIQHYGALAYDEIDTYFFGIGISNDHRKNLANLLLCAEFAKWIKKDKRGLNTYYLATANKEALQYKIDSKGPKIDKFRWRSDIVAFWKLNDPDRFSSIQSGLFK